jgi:hypothetical protein
VLVGKDAKVTNLTGQVLEIRQPISLLNSEKYQEAGPDAGNRPSFNADLGGRHPLENSPHVSALGSRISALAFNAG